MTKLCSLILAGFLALPLATSFAQVDISVGFAPPVLPVYEQPPCPVAGYLWTPGYWGYGYDAGDYYWVPGDWVAPPTVGVLWTPPWWGWNNGAYAFNDGYWGPTVGYYGGINYGYGYSGNGYWGGRWEGNSFRYNTAVTRVNNNVVHNTYVDRSVNREVNANRASFNGPNGVKAEPTAEQKAAAANAKKLPPTSQQLARKEAAAKDRNLQASVNKGHPNSDAIKSFNKGEGAGQGKGTGAEGAGAAAAAGKVGNKPGAAGAGQAGNKRGNMSEHNRQGAGAGNKAAGAGNAGANGNKLKTGNQGNNMRTTGGNQAKMHTGKGAAAGAGGGAARGPHTMNKMSHNPQMGTRNAQMGARNAQMGGKHPPVAGGGNRPAPKGQPQGKKKPGER